MPRTWHIQNLRTPPAGRCSHLVRSRTGREMFLFSHRTSYPSRSGIWRKHPAKARSCSDDTDWLAVQSPLWSETALFQERALYLLTPAHCLLSDKNLQNFLTYFSPCGRVFCEHPYRKSRVFCKHPALEKTFLFIYYRASSSLAFSLFRSFSIAKSRMRSFRVRSIVL